jgi:PhzF family phenazine biosynthesis protein
MKLTIHIVDAFTETQFKGNSAAVIITKKWLSDALMQSIAIENNLSETAFLVEGDSCFQIRWFSPITEIDFCGHATLAASSVILANDLSLSSIKLFAKAVGEFSVKRGSNDYIEMNFPSTKPQTLSDIPSALIEGLSIKPEVVLYNQQAYFAVYKNECDVLNLSYDSLLIKSLAPLDVVATAPGISFDCVSRYFWPANGGDEDPVTGSIHTGLAPYWAEVLGKQTIKAFQASARGGVLLCEVIGDRVKISGKVMPYLSGEIVLQGY